MILNSLSIRRGLLQNSQYPKQCIRKRSQKKTTHFFCGRFELLASDFQFRLLLRFHFATALFKRNSTSPSYTFMYSWRILSKITSSAGQKAYWSISPTVIQRMSLCSSFWGTPSRMAA